MLIPIGFFAASAGAVVTGSYDLLATEILTSSQASVTFSSLGTYAADYQHLQIRLVGRTTETSGTRKIKYRLNGSATGYAFHWLEGAGTSVASYASTSQSAGQIGCNLVSDADANAFGANVIDILDPFDSNKNTTLRALSGAHTSGEYRVALNSSFWNSTDSVTSITFYTEDLSSSYVTGSRFSLYGLKAA